MDKRKKCGMAAFLRQSREIWNLRKYFTTKINWYIYSMVCHIWMSQQTNVWKFKHYYMYLCIWITMHYSLTYKNKFAISHFFECHSWSLFFLLHVHALLWSYYCFTNDWNWGNHLMVVLTLDFLQCIYEKELYIMIILFCRPLDSTFHQPQVHLFLLLLLLLSLTPPFQWANRERSKRRETLTYARSSRAIW